MKIKPQLLGTIGAGVIALAMFLPLAGSDAELLQVEPQGYDCDFSDMPDSFACFLQTAIASLTPSPTKAPSQTAIPPKATTHAPTGVPSVTVVSPSPTLPTGGNQPHLGAPLCPDHSNSKFHTLWDSSRGCHYDHEHGTSPFKSEVAAAFPDFDLPVLLGGVGVGHTNPSSPAENTVKHGGFKWQVDIDQPNGRLAECVQGFEDGTIAVKSYAIQYHVFGRQDIEHEARTHSSAVLLSFCKDGNPNDVGYMYVTQLQEYGQRVMPYQGMTLTYPNSFTPQYISPRGPYFTNECEGEDTTYVDVDGSIRIVDCRDRGDTRNNNNSIWTSKPTQSSGPRERPETSKLFRLLFRIRDAYQRMDINDLVHPFTWDFVCGDTVTYNPVGCRFNNSTDTIHEVMGDIPELWDTCEAAPCTGLDTDPRDNRITMTAFVTRYGDLNLSCTAPGTDCHPLKLVGAFVGRYSSEVSVAKVSNPDPGNTPERDIYFCPVNGVVCSETSPGAVPSGWIGSEN